MAVFALRNLDFLLNADRLNANIIMLLLYFVHVFIFLYVPSQARSGEKESAPQRGIIVVG